MKDIELSLFATFAFFGFILALLPLPWLVNPANAGILALMFWVSILCFVMFINSLAWNTPVWCDIATKLVVGACVGAPASLCCLTRHLYDIVREPGSALLQRKFLYSIWMDISVAFVAPASVIFLHIIFQDHRYVVYEEAGCFPSVYPSALAYIVIFIWPILFGSMSFVYILLTLQTLHKHNYELPERLYVITTVDSDCYGRLLVYSLGSLVCNFIVGILLLHTNFQGVVLRSMSAMERDLSHVLVVPSSVWKADARVHGLIELRWACPLLALVFFALFAFTPEMRTRYLQTLGKTRAHFSRSKESDFSSSFTIQSPNEVLPVFVLPSFSSRDTNGCLHSNTAARPRDSFLSETITIVPPSPPKSQGIVEWPCYHPSSQTLSSHPSIPDSMMTIPSEMSDSIPSIPSEMMSDNSSNLTYADTFPRTTRSGATSRSSYLTCPPCEEAYPCHY